MPKNYIKGSVKEFSISGTNDKKLVASLLLADLEKIANEKGYVNIVIQARRDADAFGNTHYAFENDYKPGEGKAQGNPQTPNRPGAKLTPPVYKESFKDSRFDKDDLPF